MIEVILGTEYAGEMKKGVFTLMNHYMPKKGQLPLHSSANVGPPTFLVGHATPALASDAKMCSTNVSF